jgi:glyoxylase-like metal-dependent hydrolase (beta-lactamase superfamily II)
MKIGSVNAQVINEIESMLVPCEMLIEVADAHALERSEGWGVPEYYDRATRQLRLSVHSWLLDTGRHKILVDPCVGNLKPRGAAQAFDMLDTDFLGRMEQAGARPEDIDYVFCTHLHVDHCGWNTRLVDGRWVPTFPNAKYLFSRREEEYWKQHDTAEAAGEDFLMKANVGVFSDSVRPVIEAGQAVLLDENPHSIAGCLSIEPGYGHTIGHLIGILKSGSEGMLFAGDALHHPLQIYHPDWNTHSSYLPDEARKTRHQLLQRCVNEGLWLAAAHFMPPHMVKVVREAGSFRIA